MYVPDSTWVHGSLSEVAGQLGKMMEHSNQSQLNPVARADGTSCISRVQYRVCLPGLLFLRYPSRRRRPRWPLRSPGQ